MPGPDAPAILFDIDGTLVDSTYHHAMCWHRAFRRHDVAVPIWRLHRAIGMGGDRLVAHVTDDSVEEELGDALRDAHFEEYSKIADEVPALTGAADLVRALVDEGYRVALASSGQPEFSQKAVEILGIGDVIEVLTTSEDVEDSKPEPDLVGTTLRRLGVPRAVFVGDTPWDVEAAKRAGLGCVAVRTGGFGEDELEHAGAVAVADGPEQLRDVDWASFLREPQLD